MDERDKLIKLMQSTLEVQTYAIKMMTVIILENKQHISQVYDILQQTGIVKTLGDDSGKGPLVDDDDYDEGLDDFQDFVDGLT